MSYDPSTDFLALWRKILNGVEKAEMPGLDWWVLAMSRAGLINVVFSEVAPTVNQATTAWFKPAVPSYAAEGALYLWDADAGTYVPATPELFFRFLVKVSQRDVLAIWAVIGLPPDSLGNDGDYAVRLDDPGGVYGPKVGGHWPANPLPATSYSQVSKFLDYLSTAEGSIVYRGASSWLALSPGNSGNLLHSSGSAGDPYWSPLSTADLDAILGGGVWGDIIFRGASAWQRLAAGPNGYILETHGGSADPAWAALTTIIDTIFPGAPVGSIIEKGPGGWTYLPPGPAGLGILSQGAGNPLIYGNVQGPPGATGATGPQGPQGIQGPQGPAGSLPTTPYAVGSTMVAVDGTALANVSPGGGYMGVGATATFGFTYTGSNNPSGYFLAASTYTEGSTAISPYSLHPPGTWKIISYLGGAHINTTGMGVSISEHEYLVNILRIA